MSKNAEAIRSFYKFLDDEFNKKGFCIELEFYENNNCIFGYNDFRVDVIVNRERSCVVFKGSEAQKEEIEKGGFEIGYNLSEANFLYETIRDQLYIAKLIISIKDSNKSIILRSRMY